VLLVHPSVVEAAAVRGHHARAPRGVHDRQPADRYDRWLTATPEVKADADADQFVRAEILVLGCGAKIRHDLPPETKEFLKVNGIVVEYVDTINACATFNILNAEDRRVAAAILPHDPEATLVSS
jgi:uncharacterized protein